MLNELVVELIKSSVFICSDQLSGVGIKKVYSPASVSSGISKLAMPRGHKL